MLTCSSVTMLPTSSTVRSYWVTACLPPWLRLSPSPRPCGEMGRGSDNASSAALRPPPATEPQAIHVRRPARAAPGERWRRARSESGAAAERHRSQRRRRRHAGPAPASRRGPSGPPRARAARAAASIAASASCRPRASRSPSSLRHASDPLPPGLRAGLEPAPGLQHRRVAVGIARGPGRKPRADGQDLLAAALRHGESAASPRDRRRWLAIGRRR